jgi:hypothetical protein
VKRSALVLFACSALLFPPAARADESAMRHLRYAATARFGGESVAAVIDLDIAAIDGDRSERVVIRESTRDADFGRSIVTIDRSGDVTGATRDLTFEEETLLDLLALEFENMAGVDPGDHWDRSGDLRVGRHETHFLVRGRNDNGTIDLDVVRTMDLDDGRSGGWQGTVRYDPASVVPTLVALDGKIDDRPVALHARLTGDTFRR